MLGKLKYNFYQKVWQHAAPYGWYFVSFPKNISNEIRTTLKHEEQGWGRLKAIIKIGETQWQTSIWFDTKKDTYLLPLKKDIRKKENISLEKIISVGILV
jgi:Domain of unknown function (DUF1905)